MTFSSVQAKQHERDMSCFNRKRKCCGIIQSGGRGGLPTVVLRLRTWSKKPQKKLWLFLLGVMFCRDVFESFCAVQEQSFSSLASAKSVCREATGPKLCLLDATYTGTIYGEALRSAKAKPLPRRCDSAQLLVVECAVWVFDHFPI